MKKILTSIILAIIAIIHKPSVVVQPQPISPTAPIVSPASPRATRGAAQTIPTVAIRDIIANPNKFYKQRMVVTGKLIDTGKNYFISPNFMITDGIKNFPVSMWAPIEVAMSPGGSEPLTMKSYLGKNITLEASVELNGDQLYLYVYSAK